ncbi:phosphoesterase [Burkholderia aenigmatica]|uniref:Phosphoesterase n=1 Tax=Burkholderia aenigmatica TaxID=2015348 RepID=A0ABY6XSY0_9BURK|nr:acetyltransferase [Burkholderia aenigmatica]VWC74286.1 phosphoesterase [Burkholderia aenigmatica]VWD59977.1 phosphoesterase [Burkholderia aenigmatica]
MTRFDVFNGDADGICALHQLRLVTPAESVRVTGPKRDIALLSRVAAIRGDAVTVLDVSLDANRAALDALLAQGVDVDYFDHHVTRDVPAHPHLRAHIDTAPDTCTSVIVDRYLAGRQRLWAAVGAYGDNLVGVAGALAAAGGLTGTDARRLQVLGESINYNGYGDLPDDLFMAPLAVYEAIRQYANPLDFAQSPLAQRLAANRRRDIARAERQRAAFVLPGADVYLLPDTRWARRVRGVFANRLARREPARAHAVLTLAAGGGYTVSVRAPVAAPHGADRLCRAFPEGGGREGAAGINRLAPARLDAFVEAFASAYPAA